MVSGARFGSVWPSRRDKECAKFARDSKQNCPLSSVHLTIPHERTENEFAKLRKEPLIEVPRQRDAAVEPWRIWSYTLVIFSPGYRRSSQATKMGRKSNPSVSGW